MVIKNNGLFDDLGRHSRNRIFPEALPGMARQAVMLFRPMAMHDRGVLWVLEGAGFSYSMWEGYLKEASSRPVLDWLDRHGIAWQVLHTSGHASVADLQRFAAALAPARSCRYILSRLDGSRSSSAMSSRERTASGGTFEPDHAT